MTFQRFQEYLDDRGKFQEKPVVSKTADTGPKGAKYLPKAQTKGHKWHDVTAKDEALQIDDTPNGDGAKATPSSPKLYSPNGTDPGLLTADGGKNGKPGKNNPDPLVDKGEKDLVWNPKIDPRDPKGQRLKAAVKTFEKPPMEQFVDKTKNLSVAQYAEYVLKQNKVDGMKKIVETANTISGNNDLIEALVREIKHKGDFAKLTESLLNQPEFYQELAIILASDEGRNVAWQIAKAINEITAPPGTKDDVEEDDDKAHHTKSVKNTPVEDPNIMRSKKQYVMMQPEHHLIEALASYKSIKGTMKKIVD